MSKVFVIFGATGQQGGAIIDFILQHETFSKEFSLRGITRNASKPQAIQLKARGVEVIEVSWKTGLKRGFRNYLTEVIH
jgi:uncharacterized protein YbjT (DUF2867 family)